MEKLITVSNCDEKNLSKCENVSKEISLWRQNDIEEILYDTKFKNETNHYINKILENKFVRVMKE